MENQLLTTENLPSLVGKTISWSAPMYKGNIGYLGYGLAGGIATINAVDLNERKPITATIVEGDNIDYGFIDDPWTGKCIAYSDADRYISFEIVEPIYVIHHSTKGYYQKLSQSRNWITGTENSFRYATRYYSVEQAEKVAKTLNDLSGKPLRRLEIRVLNTPHEPYKFENALRVKELINE